MAKPTVLLSINAGSSSVKATIFQADSDEPRHIAAAEVSGLSTSAAEFTYSRNSHKQKEELPSSIKSHDDAFHHILENFLDDKALGIVSSRDHIDYACHRVVHGVGGPRSPGLTDADRLVQGDYTEEKLINDETFGHIEALEDLAPLHNSSAVAIIQSCMKQLPNVKNIASFDSAFHQHMPDHARTYAIDQRIAKEKGLRKYGFHGISYSYITRTVAKHLQKKTSELSIIALHLGSGASACAIKNGQSIDTSMGLTPLSGLPGGSRSGDIDPCLIFHYTSTASKMSPSSTRDLHITEAEEILNKKSGWKALTGTTDFSQIADPKAPPSHRLAFDMFVDRIIGYVGDYFVKLDGTVDALVFSGGIGEKSALLRERVTKKCVCLGFALEQQHNNNPREDRVVEIGKGERSTTLICRTDEQFEMAYSCVMNKL